MTAYVGPYQRDKIIICSADASPASQRTDSCEARGFFPNAKWVGACRNAAERQSCRFVVLTTAHGMVDPSERIGPYDVAIESHMEQVREKWRETIPRVLGERSRDGVVVFYAGGCPRDQYIDLLAPILHSIGVALLSFGRPNMYDIGRIDEVVERICVGASIEEVRQVLRYPDRLVFYPSCIDGGKPAI